MGRVANKINIMGACIFLLALSVVASCMNVRKSETISETQVSKEQFIKKTVAVLPVKAQSSLATDSLLSLRTAINDKLDAKVREKVIGANIIDTKNSINLLNSKGKINVLDEVIKTYDNTGIFDKGLVDSLGSTLKSDYIVFSRLKAEKMAVGIVGKGFGASLEVIIVENAKNEIAWAGSGEFKRGGMLGFGSTENKQAAEELVNLAFEKF